MRRLLLTALAALLAGCVGTAVPQPPNLSPIEPDLVAGAIPEMEGAMLNLAGEAGAAAAGAELSIWDLGAASAPVVAAIAADGSFEVSFAAPAGALRMQARDGDSRSAPLDIVPQPEGSLPLARPACIEVARELFIGGAGAAELSLNNDCDVDAELGATRLRAGDAFEIERPTGLTLPGGTRAELVVSAREGAAAEEILLVELTLEETTYLFPITVSVSTR